MDVGDWLRRLGLERYEAAFRENEIDEIVLPNLTPEDLKDLGIGLVGHRRKLLDAIAELRTEAGETTLPSHTRPITREITNATGERRQVTVMFSDLVGSTSLSARLDPEDLREIISAYHRCVADTVGHFRGFVAKYMGDGVLIYFGYPQAHEDDAERAVRAALEVLAAVGALNVSVPLQARIGIATGLVVVGDLIGSGEAQERAIVGETPNLAARLQGIAEPNMVVIADATRRLLGNLFELRDLGPRELKGIAEASRAFAVLRASPVEGRFEAMHADRLTALVGREEELELLLRRWVRAKGGEGQVALLCGEAGIGKSRLSAALMDGLAAEPHTRLRYFCSPQHTESPFFPIIGQLERAAGFGHDDTPQTKLNKLDALLAQSTTSKQDAALLADMLTLHNDGRYPALDFSPEQRRQKTLEALATQLEAVARSSPVLMSFEDAHWSDPTSLEAFGRIVDRVSTLPVLMIVTFRPEFEAPWIGQPHVTALTLNRLAQRDVGTLIDAVVGSKVLPASVRQDIVERTDGIPLFVEEMTKAVLEAETKLETMQTAAAVPSAISVPASLHASLMARLDGLGPAKEVAQIGAAIGREFPHALLVEVMPKPEPVMISLLDRVISAGLLFRKGVPPLATYLFKHALVQDAAYGTLLRQPRRAIHARIADILKTRFTHIAEGQPDLLARHYTEAGEIDKAAAFWGKAALRSLERSALVEAIEQLTRALGHLATLPSTPELRREEIKLQVAIITPLLHVRGYASPETKAAAERANLLVQQAEARGEPPEDPLLLFAVLYGLWVSNYVASSGVVMRELATQFLAFAEQKAMSAPILTAHRILGITLMCAGEIERGRAHLDRGLAIYDHSEHRPLAARFGVDARVSILSYRAWTSWFLGRPEAALKDADHAVSVAREVGQAATLIYALGHAIITYFHCGTYTQASAAIREISVLVDKTGSLHWKPHGTIGQGCVLAVTGDVSLAVHLISSGLACYRSTGAVVWTSLYLSRLATAYAELGQIDLAQSCVGEAIETLAATGERWWEAEVHRVAGEIALMSLKRDEAEGEACFQRALAVARTQQAKSWELRAAMSMARLWRDQGKRKKAQELLAPIYGWFTEGFDTLDLNLAKALLDELAQ